MVKASSILTLIIGSIALVQCAPVDGKVNEVGGAVDGGETSGTGVGKVGEIDNTGGTSEITTGIEKQSKDLTDCILVTSSPTIDTIQACVYKVLGKVDTATPTSPKEP
ncbi:hypothetical protein BJ944DRAFT_230302 [Cunninghamella echinulata]|nr:hypothetical protein BJ944DRAFT_230302 [Cunninghamella echinulata]